MKAAVWTGIRKLEIMEVPKPVPKQDEVLIKVWSAGVCTTDVHIANGFFEYGRPPHILGHEIAGEIEEIGTSVAKFTKGDRVVIETMVNCGECYYCRTGNKHLCDNGGEIGYTPYQGGYAQYVAVPARCLFRIPDNVSYDEAGIVEAVACPAGALYRLGMRFGETVLIQGAGVAGLSFVQTAHMLGAGKIIVAARSAARLDPALRFGAHVVIDVTKEDLEKRVMEETNGQGADVSIEAAGVPATIDAAVRLAGKNGRVILYGIPGDKDIVQFPVTQMILKQLSVFGASGNPHVWEPLLSMVSNGTINLKDMVTHTFPLERIHEAFELTEKRPAGMIKAVVHPWECKG